MRRATRIFTWSIALLLVGAIVLFPACQTADDGTDQPVVVEPDEPGTVESGEAQPGAEETSQPGWKERMDIAEQEDFSGEKSQKLVELGRNHFQRGEYEKAKDALHEALALQPNNREAQTLLRSTLIQLGELERDFESGQALLDRWESVKEQLLHKARVTFKEGKAAYQNEEYGTAVKKFEEVMSRIRFMPLARQELKNLEVKTKEFLVDARRKQKQQEEIREMKKRRAMQKIAQEQEFDRRQNRRKRIQKILDRARVLFEREE